MREVFFLMIFILFLICYYSAHHFLGPKGLEVLQSYSSFLIMSECFIPVNAAM